MKRKFLVLFLACLIFASIPLQANASQVTVIDSYQLFGTYEKILGEETSVTIDMPNFPVDAINEAVDARVTAVERADGAAITGEYSCDVSAGLDIHLNFWFTEPGVYYICIDYLDRIAGEQGNYSYIWTPYYYLEVHVEPGWTLSEDGVLTISGRGQLTYADATTVPWYAHVDEIKEVVIGDEITAIGDYLFSGCDSLSSVSIGNSVTTIGKKAFEWCYSLNSVTIPDSVITIGDYAFADCQSLSSVTIPASVTTIGDYAFHECYNLNTIIVDEGNPAYSSDMAGVLFDKNKTTLIQAPGAISGHYMIPESVTTIGDYAFYFCANLSSVRIGNSVTTIGENAFEWCRSLSSVTIPDSVITIGDYAFADCQSLSSVTIPDSVTTIGDYAFYDCNNLSSVSIGNSVTTIGNFAFYTCDSLSSVSIGNSVATIGNHAFYGCTSLSSVTIPDSVTTIGHQAFDRCESLSSVSIGNSVTTIGNYAFSDCTSLSSVTIPDSVTTISQGAFNNCNSLSSVTIPASVTTIGDCAFRSCDNLHTITVDDENPAYSSDMAGVLFDKNKTTLIHAPGAISGHYAIPQSVTTIGEMAFEFCDSLSSVTIPYSVTTIGYEAFYGCHDLSRIKFLGDAPTFGSRVFYDVSATAYYPMNTPTWTADVMQQYEGTITWVGLGDLVGLELLSAPTGGIVGEMPDLSGLRVELVYSNDIRLPADIIELSISGMDTSTVGRKTVTVSCGECSAEFTYGVHEGEPGVILDPSTYPESIHDYENNADDTQTLTYPGANGLVLMFSAETYTESQYDYIYVYDGSYNMIASYTGNQAAGVTLEVPGDTVIIKLTSDGSSTDYGYSFTSISTAATVIHTGSETVPAVAATCTEPGRTEGIICEICGEDIHDVIPALGHLYESVVTEPTPETNGYTTSTCIRCGDSYTHSITIYGVIAYGECGEALTWVLAEDGTLTISGEGAMADYPNWYAPWYDYLAYVTKVVIEEGVTTVGDYAFVYAEYLETVSLPDSLLSIGEGAFGECYSLGNIELPENLETLEGMAFWGCSSMTELNIPAATINIGIPQSVGSGISSINVDAANTVFASVDGVLFDKEMTALGAYPGARTATAYTVPDGVVYICFNAFAYDFNLQRIVLPASIEMIDYAAFAGCENLSEVVFGGAAPAFGEDVFGNTTLTAYYPANDTTWTSDVMQQYSGTVTWVPYGSYEVMEDGTQTEVVAGKPLSIHIDAEYSEALAEEVAVYVDDTLVDKANYTITEGSVIITFTPEYLATLEKGEYEVTVWLGDGMAESTLVVPEATHTPGDINGDGKVNNKDLTRLFQYLSNWDVEVVEEALDINGDGKVNNKDLTRLFQYLSNWDVEIF